MALTKNLLKTQLFALLASALLASSIPPQTATWVMAAAPKAVPQAAKTAPKTPAKKPASAPAAATPEVYTSVAPLELLNNPSQYLNKNVTFQGIFNNFSTVGLDYKKVFRDSKDYVSLMIKRPDVTHHTIPLAELKLIFPRKKSEEVLHLETGDQIQVKGRVFTVALGEPWLDVSDIKVLHKAKPPAKDDKCANEHC